VALAGLQMIFSTSNLLGAVPGGSDPAGPAWVCGGHGLRRCGCSRSLHDGRLADSNRDRSHGAPRHAGGGNCFMGTWGGSSEIRRFPGLLPVHDGAQ